MGSCSTCSTCSTVVLEGIRSIKISNFAGKWHTAGHAAGHGQKFVEERVCTPMLHCVTATATATAANGSAHGGIHGGTQGTVAARAAQEPSATAAARHWRGRTCAAIAQAVEGSQVGLVALNFRAGQTRLDSDAQWVEAQAHRLHVARVCAPASVRDAETNVPPDSKVGWTERPVLQIGRLRRVLVVQ